MGWCIYTLPWNVPFLMQKEGGNSSWLHLDLEQTCNRGPHSLGLLHHSWEGGIITKWAKPRIYWPCKVWSRLSVWLGSRGGYTGGCSHRYCLTQPKWVLWLPSEATLTSQWGPLLNGLGAAWESRIIYKPCVSPACPCTRKETTDLTRVRTMEATWACPGPRRG